MPCPLRRSKTPRMIRQALAFKRSLLGEAGGCSEALPLVTYGISIMFRMHRPAPHTDTCPLLYSPIFARFNQRACWKLGKNTKKLGKRLQPSAAARSIRNCQKSIERHAHRQMSCQPAQTFAGNPSKHAHQHIAISIHDFVTDGSLSRKIRACSNGALSPLEGV
ncbi:hypothetical protein V8C26DRAFT_183218 [Trichoderma gracile]